MCSDSDDTDGPPPPKRACIEPDKEADGKADEEIDQEDIFWNFFGVPIIILIILIDFN